MQSSITTLCRARTPSLLAWSLAVTFGTCALSLKISTLEASGGNASADGSEAFLENVACADYTGDDAAAWADYQRSLTQGVLQLFGNSSRVLRVLIATPVRDTPGAVANFEDNWRKLESSGSGDLFHFALFHYDDSNEHWARLQWYSDPLGPVVLRHVGQGCKPAFWFEIAPSLATEYDYVWLLDGDLRFDLFSWGLYRSFLAALEPLVSQPAVVPWAPGERSTLVPILRMATRRSGMFSIAREVFRSEVQTPLLSSRLWPALHARLRDADRASDVGLDNFWDVGAVLSSVECGRSGVLLVNGSPVRHMNYHDLWKRHICHTGCGTNCRGVSAEEVQLLRGGLQGYCDFTGNSSYMRSCTERMPCHSVSAGTRRHWVESDGGEISIIEWRGRGRLCKRYAANSERLSGDA